MSCTKIGGRRHGAESGDQRSADGVYLHELHGSEAITQFVPFVLSRFLPSEASISVDLPHLAQDIVVGLSPHAVHARHNESMKKGGKGYMIITLL